MTGDRDIGREDGWEARAARRKNWPVSCHELEEDPGDDLSATTTAEERLAMMGPLAVEAWRLAGIPIPDYERKDAPTRLIRNDTGGDGA